MIGPGLSQPQTGFTMVLQMASLFIPVLPKQRYTICVLHQMCIYIYIYIYVYIYIHICSTYIYCNPPKNRKVYPHLKNDDSQTLPFFFTAYCNYTYDRMSIPTRTINHYTWRRSYLIFMYMIIYIYGCTYVMSTIYV